MTRAESHLRLVSWVLVVSLLTAIVASAAAWWSVTRAQRGSLSEEFGLLASIAWVLVAGFAPGWLLARGRLVIAETVDATGAVTAPIGSPSLFGNSFQEERAGVLDGQRARLVQFARFLQIPLGFVPILLGMGVVWLAWPGPDPDQRGELATAVVGLLAAFPLLVLERHLAADDQGWIDASRLSLVVRFALVLLVLGVLVTGVHALGVADAYWGQRLVAVVWAAAGIELLLRGVLSAMLPPPTPESAIVWPRGAVLRLAAGLTGGGGLRQVFRLDLRQSWGLQFLRRAAGPVLLVVLLIAWTTTTVAVIGMGERGVVERLGRPIAVVQPGMAWCLPWPFGAIRRVENGQVHEVALALGGELAAGRRQMEPLSQKAAPAIGAQDRPPGESDRLWEKPHGSESIFLVPGPGAGDRGQSFHLLNADVRIIWRMGDTDAAALGAAYRVADPVLLVRAVATRQLTEAFARRTLAEVIHMDREALAIQVRGEVQDDLDALATGIEIPAVVVDAIHPPPGAALSYHGVQAAGIIAATDINIARSQQVRSRHEADLAAVIALRGREAVAREVASKAEVERARFAADRQSVAIAADALELERWLGAIGRSLGRAQITIVDARFPRDDAPYLDFRATPLPLKDQP